MYERQRAFKAIRRRQSAKRARIGGADVLTGYRAELERDGARQEDRMYEQDEEFTEEGEDGDEISNEIWQEVYNCTCIWWAGVTPDHPRPAGS